MANLSFQSIKSAFVALYGEFFNNDSFESFDEAFSDAWQAFDFVAGAESAEDFAEAMCGLPQLSQW